MIGYHVYLAHTYTEHNQHLENRHPGLRACRAHRQLEMLLLQILLLLNISRNSFQLILQQLKILPEAIKRLHIGRVLTVRNIPAHGEIQFLGLRVTLFPAEINLLEALRLNAHLRTPLVPHGLYLLAVLYGFERDVLGADARDQVVDVQDGFEVGGKPETVPVLCFEHYLQGAGLIDLADYAQCDQ